ncbi:MAG: dUTP diphosphatase [Victivallales bacterium]|nr:dUTP diphosphatase [Victivallales bacterium]
MFEKVAVKIKMLEGCDDLLPSRAHHDDAAFDLRSRVEIELGLAEPVLVPTGVFMELPPGYEAQVRPRSGLALKHALTVLNSPGTIDAGYRGEVCVIMLNAGKEPFRVARGDRIAQMVINNLPDVELLRVPGLSASTRGEGGFGSTGKS